MDVKRLLENYIADIDLILSYNEQFGGTDEEYYTQLQEKLELALDNIKTAESAHKYMCVIDKSLKY